MALKNNVLQSFFNPGSGLKKDNIVENPTHPDFSHHKLFDDPDPNKKLRDTFVVAEPDPPKPETNQRQTRDNVSLKYVSSLQKENSQQKKITVSEATDIENINFLFGLERSVIVYLFQIVKKNRSRETPPLPCRTISEAVNATIPSLKKTIQRLEKKNVIKRCSFKGGKSGWTIYSLPDQIYNDLIQLENDVSLPSNWRQTGDKPETNQRQGDVFGNTLNGGLNVEELSQPNLPEAWTNIDLSLLQETFKSLPTKKAQFFSKAQLKTIFLQAGQKLTAEDVQNSINAFAYGLTHYANTEPYKSMENPGAILFDNLKNGDRWYEQRYLNIEESRLYKKYLATIEHMEDEAIQQFKIWIDQEQDIKYDYYKTKLRSNEFYNKNIFLEMAKKDYMLNIWPTEKRKLLLNRLEKVDENLLNKFETLQFAIPNVQR